MRRRLVRALVIVALAALVEAVSAHVLATHDPVVAMIGGNGLVLLFVPLYGARLFLYFVAPPWLAVRVVRWLVDRRK